MVAKADGSVEAVYPVGSEIADILLEAEEKASAAAVERVLRLVSSSG